MVGRGTPEPKRSRTSRKTSNGNGGRTENPPAVGSVKQMFRVSQNREGCVEGQEPIIGV